MGLRLVNPEARPPCLPPPEPTHTHSLSLPPLPVVPASNLAGETARETVPTRPLAVHLSVTLPRALLPGCVRHQGFRDNNNPMTTTAWPSGLTMAASFDVDAMLEWGTGMGKEFFGKGSNVQLGPGLCLARVPRNGRNFEWVPIFAWAIPPVASAATLHGSLLHCLVPSALHCPPRPTRPHIP